MQAFLAIIFLIRICLGIFAWNYILWLGLWIWKRLNQEKNALKWTWVAQTYNFLNPSPSTHLTLSHSNFIISHISNIFTQFYYFLLSLLLPRLLNFSYYPSCYYYYCHCCFFIVIVIIINIIIFFVIIINIVIIVIITAITIVARIIVF